MKMTNNTILITGGGSGIGRALAEAFHKLGNQVIIAGRSSEKLDETTGANPDIKSFKVDMANFESIKSLASQVTEKFPLLNTVIHSAGVMVAEDLVNGNNSQTDDATVNTNLLGPIRLNEELLPVLQKQSEAAIMTVSSGLAFVPMAMTPIYCATKAGIHSYTQSLRYQLRNTAIQVIEVIPPYVATNLMGEHQANDPNAMPLGEYISETMEILTTQPDATEVLVERVRPLRFSAQEGQEKYEQFFKQFNDQATASVAEAARG
ncbi:MAG: SDR family oxidoreductase [Acidobacteriota bacterium]|nr:SDR family oxidoreductase [Acidobacteriota bacterium]